MYLLFLFLIPKLIFSLELNLVCTNNNALTNEVDVKDVFLLLNTDNKRIDLGGLSLQTRNNLLEARGIAHRISDFILESLTGEPGFFSTRLAYVVRKKNKYLLIIHDKWLSITIALFLIILLLSLYPFNSSLNQAGNDKFNHLIAYSLLSFPASLKKPPFYILICVFFVISGGLIELIQPHFNGYLDLFDFLTNTFGVFIGMIIGSFFRKNYL